MVWRQRLQLILLLLPFMVLGQEYHSRDLDFDLTKVEFRDGIDGEVEYMSKNFHHKLNTTTPFIALSAIVKGQQLEHESVAIYVYAAPDGSTKKQWIELEHDHHAEQTDNHINFPPVYINHTTKKLRFKVVKKSSSVQLESLKLNLFVPADVHPVKGDVVELENNDAGRACSCAQPASVGRSSWGSSYGLSANSSCSSVSYTTVTHLIVHHAAGTNTSTNWAGVVASIWNYHVNSNGWCDVGYNWLIDPNGVLYVGRGGGNNVVGAHMCGYNQKTMGVCMLGNYNTATPSTAAMNKLAELLAWKCCNSNIDPLGSGAITSYPGTMDNISGHRQGCSPGYTDCPGTNLFSQLSTLRTSVNSYIANGCTTTTQPSNPVNDYCSGAIDLTSQTTCNYQTYSTTNASGSLPATTPCNGFTNGNADDDVWFKFTAVSNEHTVRILNGTSFDGVIDVRSGTCNSSTSIGCDDQTGSTGIVSSVTLTNLTIGTTYFARVYHYGTGSGSGGSFQICVTHPQPTCAQPTGRATSNITPNSATFNWSVVSGASSYEVWYKKAGASTYTKATVTGTSFSPNNLDCYSNYEWSVMAYCSNNTNSGSPSSFTTFTTPNDLPNAAITHTANGYTVSFTSTNITGNPTTYSWNFGDGSAASAQANPTHTYPTAGVAVTYNVTLTLTNYCGSKDVTYTFTLTPNCVFNLSANNANIDSNQQAVTVNLTNTAKCPWTASPSCNFVAVSPASGSNDTTVTITVAENNDTASRQCIVTIAGQTYTITQSGKKVVVNCVYTLSYDSTTIDSNQQTITVQLTNAAACNWSVVGGCSFAVANPQSGSATTQTITIQIDANNDTVARQCNLLIADKTFRITQTGKTPIRVVDKCNPPLASPPLVANNCDLASSPAIANVTYEWYKNGTPIPGISSRFYTVEDDKGYFYVMITDSNNCSAVSQDVYVDCTLPPSAIQDVSEPIKVSIAPNPASTGFTIKVEGINATQIPLMLYNTLGQLVLQDVIDSNNIKYIHADKLSEGVYYLRIDAITRQHTSRILIHRD